MTMSLKNYQLFQIYFSIGANSREMSNEIVPFVDETETPPNSAHTTQANQSSSMRGCRRVMEYILDDTDPEIEFNLNSENHHMKHFFPPDKGHKYVNLFYPNSSSVKSLLEKMKEPSVLCLRGCDQLLFRADFPFEKFKTLTALEISAVSNLNTLPEEISEMTHLQSLNLSHLPIQHFPADDFFSKLINLRSLVLKACSDLHYLPQLHSLRSLVSLDLSHLPIEALPCEIFSGMEQLCRLILRGCSKLRHLPSTRLLRRLTFVDLSYTALYYKPYESSFSVKVLDLSGAQHMMGAFQIGYSEYFLKALDVSRTNIKSIELLSSLTYLSILVARNCSRLVNLIAEESLESLEVLDMSGCGSLHELPDDLCELVKLKELNLSGCTSLRQLKEGLPFFANLSNPTTHLILSRNLVDTIPELSSNIQNKKLLNVEIVEDDVASPWEGNVEANSSISNPNEFHLISTFVSMDSAFGQYTHNFTQFKDFILDIQTNMEAKSESGFKKHCGRMLADLEYIRDNIDLLESSDDKGNARKLLSHLLVALDRHQKNTFPLDSDNLKILLRLVVKLKILLPRPRQEDSDTNKEMECDFDEGPYHIDSNTHRYPDLLNSYNSLTEVQRSCLLYFAIFPMNKFRLRVKERTLIHLWYGEGFIGHPTQTQSQNATLGRTHNLDTVEEIGQHILMILKEKRFIRRAPSSRVCFMHRTEQSFVRQIAKEENFVELDEQNGKLTPQLTNGFERACLVKPEYNFASSCQLWLDYINTSDQKIECFERLRVLLNANEHIICIRAEWLSKMRNLCVLHLGNWDNQHNKHIELVDLNFLEELQNMKQLNVLSFEGVAAITKLPDSICKLNHLKVLNLRECSQMEELPDDIGSLQNLSHLDVTNCPLLSMLPKGIKLLSKLEVLKGFLITYDADVQQNINACTLADLVKVEKLRKLNLVVNLSKFPKREDLQLLKEMKNLCNLKVTWIQNHYVDERTQGDMERKTSRHFRWQHLKCWEQRIPKNVETEEPLRSSCHLDNLKKLVLSCFHSEVAPEWLHPSELQNLERFSIHGGHLKTLPGEPVHNTWNVKTLRLKYAVKLDMNWEILRQIFPKMTYFMEFPNDLLLTFPVGSNGEWRIEDEKE